MRELGYFLTFNNLSQPSLACLSIEGRKRCSCLHHYFHNVIERDFMSSVTHKRKGSMVDGSHTCHSISFYTWNLH